MPLRETDPDSFLFVCPVCRNTFRQREPMQPMCTGPFCTDDHDPTVMELAA